MKFDIWIHFENLLKKISIQRMSLEKLPGVQQWQFLYKNFTWL